MGYTQDRPLEELFDSAPLDRVTRRTAERAQELLLKTVIRFTPVDRSPESERGGRPAHALKDSWEKGPVEYRADGRVVVTVLTNRPEAPHVEYPTRPHRIEPRRDRAPASTVATQRPRGDRRRGTPEPHLRFLMAGRVVYARFVLHPGTQGSFMMHRAVALVEREWPVIARAEMEQMHNRRLR